MNWSALAAVTELQGWPNASSTRQALFPVRGVRERPQVGDPGRERAAELLDRRRPGVGEDRAVDDDGAQVPMGRGAAGDVGQPGQVLRLAARGVQA